jgi:hypothetical protein
MIRQIDGYPYGTREEVEFLYRRIDEIANAGNLVQRFQPANTGKNEDLKAIRGLLKEWGLQGISVRRAKGAGCYWPVVTIPVILPDNYGSINDHYNNRDAAKALESAIVQVFPFFQTTFPDNPYQDGCTIRLVVG